MARVNQVIPYILPEYINHVSLTWLSGGYPQQHVPLLDSVHTEVGDFSSTDEESIKYTKKTKVTTSNTWPRFLIISSTDDGALKKLSPFAIQKGLVGLAGEPKSVKKLKDGSLLVECRTDSHSKCLLKATSLCNIHIKVTPHPSLNTVKGVIRSRDLEGVSDDEMCENLSSQGVSTVKRIMVRRNDILVPINTFILTFRKHTLPQSIKAGYLNIPVDPYVPNPLRCFKCQKYGHGQNTWRNKMTCARCGQIDHDSKSCKKDIQCANCKGNHFAYSRECARWKVEKRVQQVKVEKHISFYEARKLVEALAPVATGPSYAGVVKASTKRISINTDLTWCYEENKYKNIADVETLQRQTDTDNITVRGFNLYHKCQETENRASGGVSILVNKNIPQSIVTLNTNLQAVAVKVTAHKTITLCSVYLPPRNHFNFNPKDLQSVIDPLPSPFILMGDFNGHHTLWGCK